MIGFPFQSNYLGMDEYGNPLFDRAVNAEFYRQMQKLFYNNGVFANPSTNFQVLAHSGMAIRVKPGACFVEGVTGIEINNTDLTIDSAEELTDRTDSIVLRADFTHNRRLTVEVKKGTTQLRRDSDVYELSLAQIHVRRLATSILQGDITDTRLDATVCGVVTGIPERVDTSTLFLQFQSYLEQKQAQWNEAGEQQRQAWQEQMNTQASEHSAQKQAFLNWFNGAQADITSLKGFDFENLLELPGTKHTAIKNESGVWITTIKIGERKLAEKIENPKDGQGKFITTLKLYESDGIQIKKSVTITEYKNSNGNWVTEVVGG